MTSSSTQIHQSAQFNNVDSSMPTVNPTKTMLTIKLFRSDLPNHGISPTLRIPIASTKSSVLSVITDSIKFNNVA